MGTAVMLVFITDRGRIAPAQPHVRASRAPGGLETNNQTAATLATAMSRHDPLTPMLHVAVCGTALGAFGDFLDGRPQRERHPMTPG
jgi:hypothetical protein